MENEGLHSSQEVSWQIIYGVWDSDGVGLAYGVSRLTRANPEEGKSEEIWELQITVQKEDFRSE